MTSNISLYGTSVTNGNVGSNNFTTLYSSGAGGIRAQHPYGNANVVALLNAGTDGANTVANIIATGNITANYYYGNGVHLTGITQAGNSNYANFAGNLVLSGADFPYVNLTNANIQSFIIDSNDFLNQTTVNQTPTSWDSITEDNYSSPYHSHSWIKTDNSDNTNPIFFIENQSSSNTTPQRWTFDGSGNATFPTIGTTTVNDLVVTGNLSVGNLYSNNANYANYAGNLTGGFSSTIDSRGYSLVGGSTSQAQLSLDGFPYLQAYSGSGTPWPGIWLGTGLGDTLTNKWQFGYDGNLTLPGNTFAVNYANGSPVDIGNTISANYANFAGNLVVVGNETNVYVKTANTNIESRAQVGNAYTTQYQSSNIWEVFPEDDNTGPNSSYAWLRAENNDINNPRVFIENSPADTGITQRWTFDALGNLTLPGNTFAVNYANGSPVNLDGPVANANYANFAGTAYSVSGSNVSGTVANANYSVYSGTAATANSVTLANVSGAGNIASINLTGSSSNVLYGNGTFAPVSGGGGGASISNGTSNVNIAAANGNITVGVNSNSNVAVFGNTGITSNTLTLQTSANVRKPVFNFTPDGTTYGIANANVNGLTIIDYGSQSSNAEPENFAFVKARGNSTTPTSAANNDIVMKMTASVYNGNTYPRIGFINFTAVQAAATNQSYSNVAWGAGSVGIITGNPNGNIYDTTNTGRSMQNVLTMAQTGGLTLLPGSYGASDSMSITNYGSTSAQTGRTGQIAFTRAHGNRDSQTSVANGDGLGGMRFVAFNGTGTSAESASIIASADTTYGPITSGAGQPVPSRIDIQVYGNTGTPTSQTTTFGGDGNVSFPTGKSVTAGYYYGNGSFLTGITATSANFANFAGNVTVSSQPNITSVANSFSSGQLTLNPTGAGAPQVTINGNNTGGNTGQMTLNDAGLNVNINGGSFPGGAPSFAFSTYQTGGSIPPQFYKRYGNTITTPTGVANGDQILNQYYQVYGDSGNTNLTLGGVIASVGNVYAPGNISLNYQIYSQGNAGDKFNVNFANIQLQGNVSANNVSLTKFNESVQSGGSVSGTITPDASTGTIYKYTLNGNITLNSLSNAVAGTSMTIILTQDGTGGRTLTSTMKFAGGFNTLSTSAGATDIICVFYDGTTYYATLTTGYV